MKHFLPLNLFALLLAGLFVISCSDDDATDNVRPEEGTTAYFNAMRDSICGYYLDAFEMNDNQYFSVFYFMKDDQALSILYSKKPSSDKIEVDSTKMTWKIDEKRIAQNEGKSYYALYRSAPYTSFGLTQAMVDDLIANGYTDTYTDTMVVEVDTNGHIQLLKKNSTSETDSSDDTRISWDDIKTVFHVVKAVFEDKVEEVVNEVKDTLDRITFTNKIIALGPHYRGWMRNINDDAPLRCVSIPGTHDTFTYGITYLAWSYGCTQWLDLKEQFEKGIRCFDIRLDRYKNIKGEYILELTHGGLVSCNITFDQALDAIYNCLKENDTETAIVTVKIDGSYKEEERDNYIKMIDQELVKRAQKQQIAAWNPNMTMKDARGKMVVIARYPTKECLFPIACQKDKASDLKWGDNKSDQILLVDYGTTKVTNPLWVQDCYSQSDGESGSAWLERKEKLIKENIDYLNSVDLTKEENYIWAFNQTSGYMGTHKIDMNYPEAAEELNPFMQDLLENEYRGKFTGVIVMDYGGVNAKTAGNISLIGRYTHGDLVPQAIIRNNNYLKLGDMSIVDNPIN